MALCLGVLPLQGLAADAEGDYAVSGAGSQACERFVAMVDEGDEQDAQLYARWIEGYASGLNLMLNETFDVTPFTSATPLVQLALSVCRENPEMLVELATAQVVRSLEDVRSREAGEPEELSHGDRSVLIRQETLTMAQRRLSEKGHYTSAIDGLYGPGTRGALERFQQEAGLEVTGLPDTTTLVRLFLNTSEE